MKEMPTEVSVERLKTKDLFKQYGETMMSEQSIDSLNIRDKNDSVSLKTQKMANSKKQPTILTSDLNGHTDVDNVTLNGFEFFTRFAYCQALLYKAWVETSDGLASKIMKSMDQDHNNSKEPTLYIDAFEEKFTDLFRSPEFASNMSKLLNSLMECLKEGDDASKIFLNGMQKMFENSNGKRSKSGMK